MCSMFLGAGVQTGRSQCVVCEVLPGPAQYYAGLWQPQWDTPAVGPKRAALTAPSQAQAPCLCHSHGGMQSETILMHLYESPIGSHLILKSHINAFFGGSGCSG